jgi:hypothetical protein
MSAEDSRGSRARSAPSLDPPPAAEESIEAGEDAGTLGVGDLLGTAVRLATHLPAVARAGGKLAGELAKVGIGRSDIAAPSGDWRFTDPTWTENPAYLRLMQGYLAIGEALDELVEDAQLSDWRQRERAKYLVTVMTSALVGQSR